MNMWLQRILSAFFVLSLTHDVWKTEAAKLSGVLEHENFQHRAALDQTGDFLMLWTPMEKEIHIEIQVATRGYIGIGFSPNGGMKGADIVLAWVDDQTGELHAHDRYAQGMMIPMIDEWQDIKVMGGYQNDTHTVLRFSREWNTCDSMHDFKLSGDTTHVIWSYSMEDPKGNMTMGIHDFRGSKSIFLREPRFQLPEFSDDVKSVDFLSSNVKLPENLDTLYWCQIYKFPDITTKHQMVGYVPVIQEGNFKHVHHILLNECHLNESSMHYEQWLQAGGRQCLVPNMPLSWRFCEHTIIAWAIGSEGEIYPEHVGMPLGEEYGGSNYYLMQIHYDNPSLRKVEDNSGLRIFYTDKLRDMDAGVLMFGHGVTSTMVIPPHQNWKTTGMCSTECTANNFPEDGIRVFQGLLHSHLLGRAISFRQIRNEREMPIVLKDMNYDFNYQQQRVLREEMVILPGDTLIIECDYDSTKLRNPTFGGEGTQDEMCLTYLTYYPRMKLSACLSTPKLSTIYKPLGINELYQKEAKYVKHFGEWKDVSSEEIKRRDRKFLMDPTSDYEELNISFELKKYKVKNPVGYQNKSIYDILYHEDTWKDPKVLDELQKQITYGSHSFICQDVKGKPTIGVPDTTRYPDYVKIETLADSECADSHVSEIYLTHEDEGEHAHDHHYHSQHEHDAKKDPKEMQQDPEGATASSGTVLTASVLFPLILFWIFRTYFV